MIDPIRHLIARWPKGEPSHVPLLKQGGIQAILADDAPPAFQEAARSAGIEVQRTSALPNLVTKGLWPGVARSPNVPGRGDESASASREPWVDANGYQVRFHRALKPSTPAVLGYLADESSGVRPDRVVPYETLEIAYVEARLNGGNYVLSFDPRYREALRKKEARAVAALDQLKRTAQWLGKMEALLGRPAIPIVTALVEDGPTLELANLLFRRGASPRLVAAANPPKPDPSIRCLIAAGLKAVPAAAFEHARAGATVVIDSKPDAGWRLVREQEDRNYYQLGSGQVAAYKHPIADPSEFALDVIDIINHKQRAARLWNALAAIPMATEGPRPNEMLLHIVNYGSKAESEVQARVQGHFTKATLLRPESPPSDLKIYRRGSTTEVFLPNLDRLAIVHYIR